MGWPGVTVEIERGPDHLLRARRSVPEPVTWAVGAPDTWLDACHRRPDRGSAHRRRQAAARPGSDRRHPYRSVRRSMTHRFARPTVELP